MKNTFGREIIPLNDEERLAALHRYRIENTNPEEVFNNLSHLIAQFFNVPIALISLVAKDRVFFKGNAGMERVNSLERGVSLCSLGILSDEPTVFSDALVDPCLMANPLVHGSFGLRFYAGVPIKTDDGFNIGTVCIVDKKERTLSQAESASLARFAQTVMHTIESRLIRLQQVDAEKELARKNEEMLHLNKELSFVTDTVPQLVWARDAEGRPVFLNNKWMSYTGLSYDDLVENGWSKVLHPKDAERVAAAWEKVRKKECEYEEEYRLKRFDGVYRWFLGRGIPLKDNEGRIVKWYGTSTDIHDHKNFQRQLSMQVQERTLELQQKQGLLDNILKVSPSGLTVYETITEDGRVKDFQCILSNDAAEQFTGISNSERLSKTVLQLTPSLQGTPLFLMAAKAIEEGTPFRTEYYHEPIKKWLELSVVRLDERHLINVFRDITPIKEVQMQLEEHVQQLQRTNAELEHFTYAASHDLKEPIRKIHIFCDRIKENLQQDFTNEQQHYFNRLQEAAKRMNTLIDDILNYSQAHSKERVFVPVDLNEIIAQVRQDLDFEIEEKKAVIESENLPTLPGHPRQLQQVFQNLISNAVKYSHPTRELHITVSSRKIYGREEEIINTKQDKNKLFHRIEVADNGVGFDQQDAERIFSMFQRLHTSSSRGTGLGLTIVRKVLQNHEGYAYSKGIAAAGASFVVLLPAEMKTDITGKE